MKYIICEKPGEFLLKEKPVPNRRSGESLLKIKKIGICGTDIHAFGGTQPYFNYPRILGHELAAEYIEGGAEGFKPGDKLTFIPYFHCGKCVACRNGLTNCCVTMQVFGVHIDGGMAEYITVADDYLINGEGLDHEELALVEPLAIALHGVRRAGVTNKDTVLVMGAGPIGLGLIHFAKLKGAKVIVFDINEHRLKFCKEVLKISNLINPVNDDVIKRLSEITNGDMPNVVFDATGNATVMNSGFNYLAHGGRYVLVGLQNGELKFNHPDFHKREATLMSSRNATKEDFTYVLQCIKSGSINPKQYITHKGNFDDVVHLFNDWINPENNAIKVVIDLD
ncbi:zinc-binding alcohol dehydrogenase family protein [Flavobacterium subsaxonicum]|uniref:Alcohol dehydrogenase n=1 Tax=Flavobacterium subsaxonicum WB 4.1-42 = DSM 21790 TaxID=1121898 RepID=A0A0A2MQ81_9FLAO|nr:zinc-binding alcohol dehydrogenase family protein [Flavobacterium subsaxonicum]KGO93613.1 alcohol dehydrogenase [Flavobacterium subsaxonicum WB 4.1-42 = DSM 21790]